MNFTPTRKIAALIIFLILQSCNTDLKPIQPEYRKPLESVISDMSKLTSFKQIKIITRNKKSSGLNPSNELILELTNAAIITYNTTDLDNLSRNIALKMKKSILNFDSYDWVTVAYLTDDGSPISDSTTQYAYVYRPTYIK